VFIYNSFVAESSVFIYYSRRKASSITVQYEKLCENELTTFSNY